MVRKTIEIERLREMTNAYLANEESNPDGREAVASILEAALFETGRYAGFRYLDTDEVMGAGSRRFYMIKEIK